VTPGQVAAALCATSDMERFFLIPDGVFLPLGGLQLRTMTGGLRAVDPEVARNYELTEAHARRLMKGAITGALMEASTSIQQLGILLAVFGKAARQPVSILDPAWAQEQRAQRMAEVLGLPIDQTRDPELVRGRLAELLIELQVQLETQDVTDAELDLSDFKVQFQRILQVAADQVVAEHEEAATLMPLALRQAFQDYDIQQQLREVGALLQQVGEAAEDLADDT